MTGATRKTFRPASERRGKSANPRDYDRVARTLRYLDDHWREQPSLDALARAAGLSRFHFQRLFRRWAGVSPKRFLQHLTLRDAKRRLTESASLLDTAFAAGLSGPSRLHDLFVTLESMTPGDYKDGGAGLSIRFGTSPTPFGDALFSFTPRGLCGLRFLPRGDLDPATLLGAEWPKAELTEDSRAAANWRRRVFSAQSPCGAETHDRFPNGSSELRLHVSGSPFDLLVWRALLEIPAGAVVSYGGLARALGRPGAARAVGSAVGRNPVAWLIPCHRVIRGLGTAGGYRWGTERKRAMLSWEAARA